MSSIASLHGLARFATVWREPGFTAGDWGAGGFCYSDDVLAFVRFCYDDGLVLADFDWVDWKQGAEAEALRDPAAIRADATAGQLAQLLTVAIRQDRFIEGGLAGWFKTGLMQAICDRAETLVT